MDRWYKIKIVSIVGGIFGEMRKMIVSCGIWVMFWGGRKYMMVSRYLGGNIFGGGCRIIVMIWFLVVVGIGVGVVGIGVGVVGIWGGVSWSRGDWSWSSGY